MKKLGAIVIFVWVVILGMSGMASADPVTGYSTGSFENLSWDTGFYAGYTDTNNTGVKWGASATAALSTLMAGETDINSPATAGIINPGVTLATLVWDNKDTVNNKGFNVDWVLSLALTEPQGDHIFTDSGLKVTLKNTGAAQDNIRLGILPSGTFNIKGYIFSNLRYAVSDGSLHSLNWKLGKGKESTLLLVADFRAPDPPAPAVPEPTTMLLLGLGLVGLAVFRRKSRG